MPTLAPVVVSLALIPVLAAAASAQRSGQSAEQRAEQERLLQEELRAPRPIDAAESLWIDALTWMEVRDAVAAGKTTAIVATGGIEQNGPYVVTGKHNVVLRGACEAIARELGNALCAPVVAFVPEGDIERRTGHMRYPGTISVREETYRMLLEDIAGSLAAHGFTDVVLIGDSGGNQEGLKATADALNARWTTARAWFVPEFYQYEVVERYMEEELGFDQPIDEGLHDNLYITAIMMAVDPAAVRYDQRVKAGRASINGASIAPKERTAELGRKLLAFRAQHTVRALRAAMAAAGRD
jgi:creatinine amidohydrolase/Fe(II)-dependent formamide hydrolase-like protein